MHKEHTKYIHGWVASVEWYLLLQYKECQILQYCTTWQNRQYQSLMNVMWTCCTNIHDQYEMQCIRFCLFLLSGKLKLKHVCMCRCSLEWVDWKEGSLAFSQDRSIGRHQLGAMACCLQTAGAPARKGGPSLVLLPTLLMGELFSSETWDPKTYWTFVIPWTVYQVTEGTYKRKCFLGLCLKQQTPPTPKHITIKMWVPYNYMPLE